MKYFLSLCLFLFASILGSNAGERVTIYARLQAKTPVKLTNGAEWVMEKGDCFPIIAYKESGTKVILKLAGSQFMIDAKLAREVPENEVPHALESYRANVNTYINSAPEKWKSEAEKESASKKAE